jgi:membrane-bound lytic murein transglycosylase B
MLKCVVASTVLLAAHALAGDGAKPLRAEIESFVTAVAARHQIDAAELRLIMRHAQVQRDIVRLMTGQSTASPWHRYRPLYVNADRIAGGLRFWDRHAQVLERAEQEFGVPAELIVATIGVETIYGTFMGTHRVLDALTTLAFEVPRRAEFFKGELEQFLLMARDRVVDPLRMRGSYAGAMGIPQFLPSSFQRYAIDFDGDGRKNLWDSAADAIGSVANYYRVFGWQTGRPVVIAARVQGDAYRALADQGIEPKISADALRDAGVTPAEDLGDARAAMLVLEGVSGPEYWLGLNNFYVITRYNRSTNYAMSVHELAREIERARSARGR